MCWYIYGALQGDVEAEALNAVNNRHNCRMVQGTRHALKMALLSGAWDYRVTDGYCDCESDIGAHDPNAAEVADMAGLIQEEIWQKNMQKRNLFCGLRRSSIKRSRSTSGRVCRKPPYCATRTANGTG